MISVSVENIDALKKKQTYLKSKQDALNVRMAKLAVTIQSMIRLKMNDELGSKAKHFSVNVNFIGLGMTISVRPIDDIGRYLYRGTKSHEISTSSKPMPMPDGNFTYNVTHPGTPSIRPKIDKIVRMSVYAARNLVR